MKIANALARAVEAVRQTYWPRKYQAAGKQVRCSHCGGDSFEIPRLVICAGHALQCSQCGHLECFGKEPIEIPKLTNAARLDSTSET